MNPLLRMFRLSFAALLLAIVSLGGGWAWTQSVVAVSDWLLPEDAAWSARVMVAAILMLGSGILIRRATDAFFDWQRRRIWRKTEALRVRLEDLKAQLAKEAGRE